MHEDRLADALETRPLAPGLGCEVLLDRRDLLAGTFSATIRSLLVEHGVLRFPQAALDDNEQQTFAATLGRIAFDWDVSADRSVNRNAVLAEYQKSSIFWHFDGFGTDVPEFATIMSPRALANGSSAATEFANCYAAYAAMPEAERAAIDGLQVWHSFETQMLNVKPDAPEAERQVWRDGAAPHVQPLVWHHASGRNSLLLGTSAYAVEGMAEAEGRALIDRMNAWITRPEFVYRYEWTIGDLVIWNNTGTLHRAVPYGENSKRLMHRTTIAGDEAPR